MRIEIESTSRVVTFEVDGARVPALIWEGRSESGVPVHCFITRICPSIPEPLPAEVAEAFAAELRVCTPPTEAVVGIPLRMVL